MYDASLGTGANARSYLTGLSLALVLTVIPFSLVYYKPVATNVILLVIAVAAITQIVIHLKYFLYLSFNGTPRESLLALCFAAILILIMVGGSLWIMYDLHYRMGPLEHRPASNH